MLVQSEHLTLQPFTPHDRQQIFVQLSQSSGKGCIGGKANNAGLHQLRIVMARINHHAAVAGQSKSGINAEYSHLASA